MRVALWLLLSVGCVLDRTGQSASFQYGQLLAEHGTRIRDLESLSEDVGRRVAQLEEVTRANGQDAILKMETVEQLRDEVARMRGEIEQLDHDYRTYETAGLGVQMDVDSRLLYAETRVAALEKSLGLRPPPNPSSLPPVTAPPGDPTVTTPPPTDPTVTTPPVAATAEETFGLITGHLEANNGPAARAVAERFIAENPKSDRVAEARYRIAESYQNEKEYKAAATAFQGVIDAAPDSTWAAWALLRQGECFDGLDRPKDAKLFYCDVVKKYPKSKAAKEAKLKCTP